jgi:GAF domain-containing protein
VPGFVFGILEDTPLHPFNQNEIDLLLTFANYATLAWEHAVLYERSDERLREAIMRSMNDGLLLTGIDGTA